MQAIVQALAALDKALGCRFLTICYSFNAMQGHSLVVRFHYSIRTMHVNQRALLLALFTGVGSALPGLAQPTDFLENLKPLGDAKLSVVNQAFDAQETASKQVDAQKAALSPSDIKPDTVSQQMEPTGSAVPTELGKQQDKAQTSDDMQPQAATAYGTQKAENGGGSLQNKTAEVAPSFEQAKAPTAEQPSPVVVLKKPINA